MNNTLLSPTEQHSAECIRLILGDQLNAKHSWFRSKDNSVVYVIAELHQETGYTKHHVQKVCAFFSAMQAFANALKQAGHRVLHLTLDDTAHFDHLDALIIHLLQAYQAHRFEYQLPDEYRLRDQLRQLCLQLQLEEPNPDKVTSDRQALDQTGRAISCRYTETEHFYLTEAQIAKEFVANKRHQLEAFYRRIRKRTGILMQEGNPEGGAWNFDKENRDKLKPADFNAVPSPLLFANDVSDILERLERHHVETIGEAQQQLLWPVTRKQALELLDHFCRYNLVNFGRFQDAMTGRLDSLLEQKQWSLYHSRLSFALNAKILSPHQVVDAAIAAYRANPAITIAQIEGFVRQIIGWREFVRGVYWANMPNYATLNTLNAKRDLPEWFWSGKTHMRCQQHVIGQSLTHSYAHHIQRLMVTGNFCLIAGIDPDQVDDWYLGIYVDAIEWVEMPNTRGMSQFADGGVVGSKAYAASGNYMKKMSDYCGDCHYEVSQTTESNACPLNSLYWHFMVTHQENFASNPRNRMVYANWNKRTPEAQAAVLNKAQSLLSHINQL